MGKKKVVKEFKKMIKNAKLMNFGGLGAIVLVVDVFFFMRVN